MLGLDHLVEYFVDVRLKRSRVVDVELEVPERLDAVGLWGPLRLLGRVDAVLSWLPLFSVAGNSTNGPQQGMGQ